MWRSKPGDGTWDNEGITEEEVGNTNLDCSADALNLDAEMTGKRSRVYWPKDKAWYKGTIKCYCMRPTLIRMLLQWKDTTTLCMTRRRRNGAAARAD